ncbi:putative rhamnogalacturonate lyase A [Diplonema papillatum]|nr:putative rhamnogalacturonate lyase A [Diplonema papillatum]
MARRLAAAVAVLALTLLPEAVDAAFGYTTSSGYYQIDSGAGLVIRVRRVDAGSSTSIGDIMSLKYNGVEYQLQNKGTHLASGFDWLYDNQGGVNLSIATVNSNVKVTIGAKYMTHYYIVKENVNNVYMGSYYTQNSARSEHRFLCRLRQSNLPNGPDESDVSTSGNTVIESADVQRTPSGHTRSKHYSGRRLREWKYMGVSGTGVGIWLVRDNGEGHSGGPFYKVIQNQHTGSAQEVTLYFSYGMSQTEAFRKNTLVLYTLVVTDGSPPPTPSLSFLSNMGLIGYVSSRGLVTGNGLRPRNTKYQYHVGFSNARAQYFTTSYGSNGAWRCPDIIPGTYKMTVYKNELEVHVVQGLVVQANTRILNTMTIPNDPSFATAIWRIGDWDGTPLELRNGDRVNLMHPSDVRMSSWNPGAFVVGTHTATDMPAYFFKSINNGFEVHFKLTAAQIRVGHRVRIGITVAYKNGRPQAQVNGWSGSIPGIRSQPQTRSLTVGTYRGNNEMYEYNVPASAWKSDPTETNILKIWVVSGSSGSGYLSPAFSLDCIDLLCTNCDVEGTYRIISKVSGLVLDVAFSSTENSANVQQYGYIGGTNQQWTVSDAGSGYYKIVNVNSGLALEVMGESTDDGANVVQYDYWGGTNQQWAIEEIGDDGYLSIVNRGSGHALEVEASSTSNSANIQQGTNAEADNQLWYFNSV